MRIVKGCRIPVLQKSVPVAVAECALEKHQIHVHLARVDVVPMQNAKPESTVLQDCAKVCKIML